MDWTNVKVKKLNKTTRVFDGTAIMHIPIDDSIEVEGRLYMKQGGEYRLLPYKSSKTGACSFTQADKFFYEDVTKSSDFEFPFPCPLPNVSCEIFSKILTNMINLHYFQKTYEIRNFVPSYDNFPLHILRSGDYAAEGYVTRNDETLFVWRGYLSIINLA